MSRFDLYVNWGLLALATLHTAFIASDFSYPSVLLWLVVLANAQVSRLMQPVAQPVAVEPDAELRKELDELKSKVSALSLAKGLQRRQV